MWVATRRWRTAFVYNNAIVEPGQVIDPAGIPINTFKSIREMGWIEEVPDPAPEEATASQAPDVHETPITAPIPAKSAAGKPQGVRKSANR